MASGAATRPARRRVPPIRATGTATANAVIAENADFFLVDTGPEEPGNARPRKPTAVGKAHADFPAWADDTGNELLEWHEEDGKLVFYIKKGEED